MRLTKQQTETIAQTVTRLAGIGSAIYLFGSRLNDQAKGGDIDLLIESDTELSLIQRAQIKMELGSQLGLSVDIVSKYRGAVATTFQVIAQSQSTQLEM
ncbi:nucleotidyltransferase domain-containing protein [Methylicorpusculum oleiharenae]|uniref:nucleotidyltransferase domain-containing protein n=1 Tax=Methylicorpusculum oleiharenae TaxID=1338687 RepID=UPI00135C2CBE|nr:nucleotidyltransferase domain-containing protein [Methylicorpusculum oleiharenae]MCD2450810.1 nucleotidyltransferase domain-containing protein [Methylicorpusculum oleiharenae]